jgi:hypothetical protein
MFIGLEYRVEGEGLSAVAVALQKTYRVYPGPTNPWLLGRRVDRTLINREAPVGIRNLLSRPEAHR